MVETIGSPTTSAFSKWIFLAWDGSAVRHVERNLHPTRTTYLDAMNSKTSLSFDTPYQAMVDE